MNTKVVSQDMSDPTIIKVDLSAQCIARFKCSTVQVAEQLLKNLSARDIDVTVALDFPGASF